MLPGLVRSGQLHADGTGQRDASRWLSPQSSPAGVREGDRSAAGNGEDQITEYQLVQGVWEAGSHGWHQRKVTRAVAYARFFQRGNPYRSKSDRPIIEKGPIDRGSDRPIIEKGPIDRGSYRPNAR